MLGWAGLCVRSVSSVRISTTDPPAGAECWPQALSIVALNVRKGNVNAIFRKKWQLGKVKEGIGESKAWGKGWRGER